MLEGKFGLAIAAGMAATVNPCGFALLPAYLSAFLGDEERPSRPGRGELWRAITVSVAMTAGFVAVFGTFGIIVTPLALSIEEHLPWVTIVIGSGLVILGIAMLSGRQPSLRIPKLQRGGRDGTLPSMFLFGVSYATASLSCTVGPFLAVTTSTFRSSSFIAGVATFFAYALGMGIVIGGLTTALAFARKALVMRLRRALPIIQRVGGALVLLAGAYVAYYGWYEIRVLEGDTDDPIVEGALEIQQWLSDKIVPENPGQVGLFALALIAAGVGIAVVRNAARNQNAN